MKIMFYKILEYNDFGKKEEEIGIFKKYVNENNAKKN